MAGREHTFQRPIIAHNLIAMRDNMVGRETLISAFLKTRPVKCLGLGLGV
jgi:hypothetical protein